MSNDELVLVALAGMPLDVTELQHATGLAFYPLWVVLEGLRERGLVTEMPRADGLGGCPMRFRLC